MSLAFYLHPGIKCLMRLDERSSAFCALGVSMASKSPAVIITSSGTATTELHPAVAEASLSCVPLIVITADRPFELHDIGAPQTMNQIGIYGDSVRYEIDWPPPSEADRSAWGPLASRLYSFAVKPGQMGPVHLNVQFREPLIDDESTSHRYELTQDIKTEISVGAIADNCAELNRSSCNEVLSFVENVLRLDVESRDGFKSGLILALGPPGNIDSQVLLQVAEALNWPILAESRSDLKIEHNRVVGSVNLITEYLIKSENFNLLQNLGLIVVSGSSPTSKALMTWLTLAKARGIKFLFLNTSFKHNDHLHLSDMYVNNNPEVLLGELVKKLHLKFNSGHILDELIKLDRAFQKSMQSKFDDDGLNAAKISYLLGRHLDSYDALVLSSSMPIRDFETYGGIVPKTLKVYSNRGVNGIDGVVSTAVGVSFGLYDQINWASTDSANNKNNVVCLIGDLAFLYDLSAFVEISDNIKEQISVTFVVVDNSGGAIFSYLSQQKVIEPDLFNQLFTTPHNVNIAEVATSLGLKVYTPLSSLEFTDVLIESSGIPGIKVIVVKTSIETDKKVSESIRSL